MLSPKVAQAGIVKGRQEGRMATGWMGPRRYDWIIEGKLAASSYPRDDEHLRALHAAGVRALVTLHERPVDQDKLDALGIAAQHLPCPGLCGAIAGPDRGGHCVHQAQAGCRGRRRRALCRRPRAHRHGHRLLSGPRGVRAGRGHRPRSLPKTRLGRNRRAASHRLRLCPPPAIGSRWPGPSQGRQLLPGI